MLLAGGALKSIPNDHGQTPVYFTTVAMRNLFGFQDAPITNTDFETTLKNQKSAPKLETMKSRNHGMEVRFSDKPEFKSWRVNYIYIYIYRNQHTYKQQREN